RTADPTSLHGECNMTWSKVHVWMLRLGWTLGVVLLGWQLLDLVVAVAAPERMHFADRQDAINVLGSYWKVKAALFALCLIGCIVSWISFFREQVDSERPSHS